MTLLAAVQARRSRETDAPSGPPLRDYLEIAFLRGGAAECEPALTRHGLLPDADQRALRLRLFLLAAAVLIGVAGVKIAVAFARGRVLPVGPYFRYARACASSGRSVSAAAAISSTRW